jgi:hypothetical protein
MQGFQLETHLCAMYLDGVFSTAAAGRTKGVSSHTKSKITEAPLSFNRFVVAKNAGVLFVHRGSLISITGGDEVKIYSSMNNYPMAVEIIRNTLPNSSADKHIRTSFRNITEVRALQL